MQFEQPRMNDIFKNMHIDDHIFLRFPVTLSVNPASLNPAANEEEGIPILSSIIFFTNISDRMMACMVVEEEK